MINKARRYVKKHGGLKPATQKFKEAIQEYGFGNIAKRIIGLQPDKDVLYTNFYNKWLAENEVNYTASEAKDKIQTFKLMPKISVLIPVYNVEDVYLRACIDSVINQYYENWELCIADDNSTDPHVKETLTEYINMDKRVKVVFRKQNGHISEATNSALEIATGEYIALLDNDDFIRPEALMEMVAMINEHPEADMLYSDEDKVDATGKVRLGPFFKPDWSPDAFLCHMYLCHLGVYRRTIALEIGGFRTEYVGSQDYDFALRFSEKTRHIYHVPKILYHWRMIPTSTSMSQGNKNYAFDASVRAKTDAANRRNYQVDILPVEQYGTTYFNYHVSKEDMISIIMPTRNQGELVKKAIDSIYEVSTWENFEILLIDNGSDDKASLMIFEALAQQHDNFSILRIDEPFNYSRLNNLAAAKARGQFLMFLNNDIQIITPNWMELMMGQAKQMHTGAVGARLYFENDTTQHAGIVLLDGVPAHAFMNIHKTDMGYFGRAALNYNYLAVTGAALMIDKNKFDQVGGFDEKFPIAYNDVDLGVKLYEAGYYNVNRGDVEMYHYESLTRGRDEDSPEKSKRLAEELKAFHKKWQNKYAKYDPFYNPNLTVRFSDFSLRNYKNEKK